YTSYNSQDFYLSINSLSFIIIVILLLFSQLLSYKFLLIKLQRIFKIILSFIVITAIVYMISAEKNVSYLLYCFAPAAILSADFMKKIPKIWMKEAFILLIFIGSLGYFLANNL